MKSIINKKGVSTIEIVISFVLFLTFIIVILSYLNPLKKPATLSLTDDLANEIDRHAQIKLETIGIFIDENTALSASCFLINNPFQSENVFVLNGSEEEVSSYRSGNQIMFKNLDEHYSYYIYYGSDMEIPSASLAGCSSAEPSIGITKEEKLYSYKILEDMNKSYYDGNYNQLKAQLMLPMQLDFSIKIYDEITGKIYFDMNKNVPKTSVVAAQYPIEILKNSQKIPATMRVMSW